MTSEESEGTPRTDVTITNRNRAAVRSIGRRFRPGIPRALRLTDVQLNVVRGNPWLWIEGEDWDGEEEPVDLDAFHDVELRELAHFLKIPGARKASRTELIESIEEAQEEVASQIAAGDEEYGELSAADLSEELRSRGLPVSGNKDVLIARLQADDVEDEDVPDEEPDDDGGEEG